jgi:hypothetical protein
MKNIILLSFLIICVSTLAVAQTKPEAPQMTRTAKGQVLTSASTPAVELEFDQAFKYAGGHSFVLYDVANAEQHFFVDADAEGKIRRLYWIQFEGYLPTNTHSYDYKSTKIVKIGELDFFADSYARSLKTNMGRADSDGNRARAYLASKGFRLDSGEVLSQRLVHLVDAEKRNELMIIYLEDLAPLNLTAADLNEGGSAYSRWSEVAQGLLDRAQKNLKIRSK